MKVSRLFVLPILILSACTNGARGSAESRFPESQASMIESSTTAASRRLLDFGTAHPECAMWSDWQKICSRTGPGGSVHCNVETGRSVEPSQPFCAHRTMEGRWPEAQREAANRFCAEYETRDHELSSGAIERYRRCRRYESNRPFNGRRIASLMHPGCGAWSDERTRELICTVDGSEGVPTCSSLAESDYEHTWQLTCSAWIGSRACHAYPINERRDYTQGDMYIPTSPDVLRPVHGLACENF